MNHERPYFPISDDALAYLSGRCVRLRRAIEIIPPIRNPIEPDPFAAVVSTIVGQQISGKAQDGILARISAQFGKIAIENLSDASVEDLRGAGVSERKANTIRTFISEIQNGKLNLAEFETAPDQEIIDRLTALKGIGLWTAEMLLIFTLQRPNVISFGDLGIRRGLSRLYGKEKIDRSFFEDRAALYSPVATVASLYLWKIAGPDCPTEFICS